MSHYACLDLLHECLKVIILATADVTADVTAATYLLCDTVSVRHMRQGKYSMT
jgi:hypothetical protein